MVKLDLSFDIFLGVDKHWSLIYALNQDSACVQV